MHVRAQVSALLGDMTKTGGSVLRTGSLAYVAQVRACSACITSINIVTIYYDYTSQSGIFLAARRL